MKGEGDIWLTVLTKQVFVQSHYLDMLTEREEPDHSHKFVQYTTVKVGSKFCKIHNYRYLICKHVMNVGSEVISSAV